MTCSCAIKNNDISNTNKNNNNNNNNNDDDDDVIECWAILGHKIVRPLKVPL